MKKSVALLIAAVTLVGCVGLFGLYTALDVKAKAKVKKETTMTDSSGMVTREYNSESLMKSRWRATSRWSLCREPIKR